MPRLDISRRGRISRKRTRDDFLKLSPSLINQQKLVPIIGNSIIYDNIFGSTEAVVAAWAEDTEYPLPSNNLELAQIAQAFRVQTDYYETTQHFLDSLKSYLLSRARDDQDVDQDAVDEMEAQFETLTFYELAYELGYPRFDGARDNPFRLLADLPLPIYLTTSYHAFMESALVEAGKKPRTEICYWRDGLSHIPSVFDENPGYVPTAEETLVYHLYGFDQYPESMVLTESDYLDFLVKIRRDASTITPVVVQRALVKGAPVLLDSDWESWNLKALLHGLMTSTDNTRRPRGLVCISISREKEREYLEKYFAEYNLDIYWSNFQSFVQELWEVWAQSR